MVDEIKSTSEVVLSGHFSLAVTCPDQPTCFDINSSTSLPLHEGLIVTTDGPKVEVVVSEHGTDNMFGMATVRAWSSSHAGRIVEQCHETVVISASKKLAIGGARDTVDVSAICALRVDSLDVPSELHGRGSPSDFSSVGPSRWILRDGIGLCEEKFVGSAVSSNPCIIFRPVKGHDV